MLQHSRYCGGKQIEKVWITNNEDMCMRSNTNSRSEDLLQDADELMIDVNGQIAEYLSVLGQIEIL